MILYFLTRSKFIFKKILVIFGKVQNVSDSIETDLTFIQIFISIYIRNMPIANVQIGKLGKKKLF